MPKAESGHRVLIHYVGSLDDGTVFDSTREREPFDYEIGKRRVIRGFEEAVIGLSTGEKITVRIPVEKAYGPVKEDLIIRIPPSKYPSNLKPTLGKNIHLVTDDGKSLVAKVVEIGEDFIMLDGNHPLAGKDLIFEIELLEILK